MTIRTVQSCLPNGASKIVIVILILIIAASLHVFYYKPASIMDPLSKVVAGAIPGSFTKEKENASLDLELQKVHFEAKKKTRLQAMRDSSKADQLANLQMYVVPQLACPTMVRAGFLGDGGKWVCNPWRVPKDDCVVYSFGVHGDVSFEQDLYETTGKRCKIYCVDPGAQAPKLMEPFKGVFVQAAVAGHADGAGLKTSILDLMDRFEHKKIDILKMDIEGSEFDSLTGFFSAANISDTESTICQLLVEFHHSSGRLETWLDMFETLEKQGFRMFSKEANMYCPGCYEFSYMHLSCFEQYGLKEDATFATFFV